MTRFFTLGAFGKGAIQARHDQKERLEEFTERVAAGEFHKHITSNVTIPVRCVDGRNLSEGMHPLAPNAAGGTESLFVADDLTTKRFTGGDSSTLAGYKNILETLQAAGYEVGGHTDSHATDDKSGCGANDRLREIYEFIAENANVLRAVAADLGIHVSDEVHEEIMKNAADRTEFSKGAELFATLKEYAKEEFIDRLDGEHNEVVAVINTRPKTTLDRYALAAEFGSNYEAFNVDLWSFETAAQAIAKTDKEAQQKLAAMVYYNLATTMVLAGPEMRVVVIK
ncbi:MAG TPA: cadmium-containing carbonic anhydrase [Candidatus Saccharimonadales bacterium]|nr:cadmium-containing carbonic anhydrase [Candidatus Saccharimonadales bacterium]